MDRARCPRAAFARLRCESSSVRPGASPFQNGIVGGAPCASSTRTRPGSTRRMRHEVVPSRNTSPARLSTAKSSSSVPTVVPSGSATTMYCAVSGMAPPEVMAVSRAPRRARTRRLTASRCRYAPARPREVEMPSESVSSTASKSATLQRAVRPRAAHQIEQLVFADIFRRAHAATICCARISSGLLRNLDAIQFARSDRAHQRGAFDQFIARGDEQAALGQRAHPVPRASDALQRDRDGARRADLADQVHANRYRCPIRARRLPPPPSVRRS